MMGAGVLDLVEDTIAAGAEPDAARAWWLNELARTAAERGVEPSQLPRDRSHTWRGVIDSSRQER